jgi:acyl-CoA thioesterase
MSMPFNDLLGIRLVEDHNDGVTIEMPIRADLLNLNGVVHGGATASLVDAALGIAITRKWEGRLTSTVEMKLNYLRPAREGKLIARSRFVKQGKTIVVGTVDVVDDSGAGIAFGLLTYMLTEPRLTEPRP